jgi:hypothetical protein
MALEDDQRISDVVEREPIPPGDPPAFGFGPTAGESQG